MVRSPCVVCETGETGVGGKSATRAVIFPLFVVYFRCNIKKMIIIKLRHREWG